MQLFSLIILSSDVNSFSCTHTAFKLSFAKRRYRQEDRTRLCEKLNRNVNKKQNDIQEETSKIRSNFLFIRLKKNYLLETGFHIFSLSNCRYGYLVTAVRSVLHINLFKYHFRAGLWTIRFVLQNLWGHIRSNKL